MELTELIFGEGAAFLANLARYIVPLLCIAVVVRCVRSMLRERYEPETWAYLYLPGEIMVPLRHWECIVGRARNTDACIEHESIDKLHACLIRDADGAWTVYDLGRGETQVNGEHVGPGGLPIEDADVLTLGDVPARFVDLTEEERASLLKYRHKPGRLVRPAGTVLLLNVLNILLALEQLVYNPDAGVLAAMGFGALCVFEWVYLAVLRASGQRGFETELLGFFLSTIGFSVAVSSVPGAVVKQLIFLAAGIGLFLFFGIWMRDLRRMKKLRLPALVLALAFLALNLVLAKVTNGAQNWVEIAGFSFQPSEFVKILYIYAGAATLDRLFVNRNLLFFIGFSAACVGALALMSDFGTAVVFFTAFLVISFMRSGSFATVFLALAAAALGVFLVLTVKPYVIARFQTWGHVWEDVYGAGYQQVRAMSAAAGGGFFGHGAGNGWLVDIVAGDTDMVFGVVCEELGLLTGLCCVASVLALAAFVVKNASGNRSSYFVIAACGAVTMMMVQLALNVFGSMDILPFTGVTFPFVSRGGSSLLACWALLAFVKGADNRANASFAVKRAERFSGGAGVEEDDGPAYDDSDDDDGDGWHRDDPEAAR